MNCPHCGASNLDTSSICVICNRPLTLGASSSGSPQTYAPPPPPPPPSGSYNAGSYAAGSPAQGQIPNYLVQSILVTICCCVPLGIVAIIFSAQVNSKLAAGDIAGAQEASDKAKKYCWISFGLGIVISIIIFLLNVAGVLAGMAQ